MVDPNNQDVGTAFNHLNSTMAPQQGLGGKKGLDAAKCASPLPAAPNPIAAATYLWAQHPHIATARTITNAPRRPRRYVLMWNVARKLYIRKRLRGEWFPEDLKKKKAPSGRRGAPHRTRGATLFFLLSSARRFFSALRRARALITPARILCAFMSPPPLPCRFILHPNSTTRRVWDCCLLIFVLFNAVEVPFVVGRGAQKHTHERLLARWLTACSPPPPAADGLLPRSSPRSQQATHLARSRAGSTRPRRDSSMCSIRSSRASLPSTSSSTFKPASWTSSAAPAPCAAAPPRPVKPRQAPQPSMRIAGAGRPLTRPLPPASLPPQVNVDRADIAKAYTESSWFWIDIAATIPFDTIVTASIGKSDNNNLRLLGFLKARHKTQAARPDGLSACCRLIPYCSRPA